MPAPVTRSMTMDQALESVASRCGDRVAIWADGTRITYRALVHQAATVAAHLQHLGVRKGSRIATLLWNQPEFVDLFFAAAHLGAVIVPLPARIRRAALEDLLRSLTPGLIVVSEANEIEGGLDTLVALRDSVRPRAAIAVVGTPFPGTLPFADFLTPAPEPAPLAEPVGPQDLHAIIYTSGTTGRPKGAMHSHRSLIAPVIASLRLREMWLTPVPGPARLARYARVLMRYGLRLLQAAGRPQVMLSTMPLHTISGVEAMLQALLMGDSLVMLPRFHPARTLEAIHRRRVTVLIGTPFTYQALLAVRGFERHRLSSLLICALGAAPCPPELARRIRQHFRCAVHIGFGMTELGGGIAAPDIEDSDQRQTDTVGRAMPGMEVRIVDEQHRPVPDGVVGELACRSDSIMLGYFGEATDSGVSVDADGWLYTGDLALRDANGYLRIVGRKKDVIIRGGQNIDPLRLERFLAAIPGVRDAAVVGVPNPLAGEAVWAFVALEPAADLSEADLLKRCRAGLEAQEVPQQIRLMSDLPRTATGKHRKAELREEALQESTTHDQAKRAQADV